MNKSITVHQKKRGRPATGRDPAVTIRLPQETLDAVERWAAEQDDKPARSPAIGRLVELGLTVKAPRKRSGEGQKARAKELAGAAIDKIAGGDSSPDEKASRKGRLIKGPEEFRETRVDRPKRN
jgi:hypothetical protein